MPTDPMPLMLETRHRLTDVTSDGASLQWHRDETLVEPLAWAPYEGCLWEFIQLTRSEDDRLPERNYEQALLAFANKWGMLGLCDEHEEPTAYPHPGLDGTVICQLASREQISVWHEFADRARALMSIGADLDARVPTSLGDWVVATPDWVRPPSRVFLNEVNQYGRARLFLNEAVTRFWVERGGVHPSAVLDDEGHSQLALRSDTVFGMLAAQMLAVLVSNEGPYRCSREQCRLPGPSRKRPAPGLPFYCSDECRQIVRRAAFKRSRERAAQRQQEELQVAMADVQLPRRASRRGAAAQEPGETREDVLVRKVVERRKRGAGGQTG